MAKTIASGLFIVRKDNKVLICHPTNHAADFYSIPKGKVEDDEIFLEAAIRETYEETNLDLSETTDFTIYPLKAVNYKNKNKILYPFLYLENKKSSFDWDGVEFKCNSNVPEDRGGFPEMDGYKWVTLDEASKVLHDTQVACIDKIKEIITE
jgi:8-oxo-dGTP pyrophosphatase MutT (NUDIX family)